MTVKVKNILISIAMVFLLITLIIYSKDTAETIRHCIEICMKTLIPSIFAYMILCTFLINSGLSEIITAPLWYLSRRFIKLDKKLFSVLVLSLIAGYPVGTKMLKEVVSQNKNYTEIARRIAPFCYAGGPAFIIGIAGNVVYNSSAAGLIIFLSCTISNILCIIFITRKEKENNPLLNKQTDTSGKIVSSALLSSAKAIMIICLSMIVFNIATDLFSCLTENTLCDTTAFRYVKSIIEVTNICTLDATTPLWLMTFFISFGGLCVIFQIYLIADGTIRFFRFALFRLIPSALSSAICFVITEISGFEAYIPATNVKSPMLTIENPLVLFSVGSMSLILIAYLSDQIKIFKKY